jgi:Tfp pilus assembly protein PilF
MNRSLALLALGALTFPSMAKLDQVGELIEKGRQALETGKPADAQKLFEQAAEQDKNSLRTRTWVLRSWMDQGRINDTLDAIDALSKGGAKGPEIDYLYGMAFSQKARGYLTSGVSSGPIQMSLEDAVQFLEKATKADPELARDAFVPLAEAAWYCQKLDVARAAADAAVKRSPKDGDAQLMLGQIAFSQYSAAKDDPAKTSEADAAWEAAKGAFGQAVLLFPPKDAASIDKLVRADLNLGNLMAWKKRWPEAQLAYVAAIVAKPSAVDLTQIQPALGGERFLATVEAALPELSKNEKADPADGASLTWWVGWARLDQTQYAKAEEALAAAVAKRPEFVNTWYFLAVAREGKKDMEGALDALKKYSDANAEDLGVMLLKDPDTSVRVIDGLVGFCAENQRNEDAAFLSELECEIRPDESRYWNNAGLFWREAGDGLRKGDDPEGKKKAPALFEKSWKAYSRALEIEPENPALLNDAAVILHYYLDRDLGKARAMYKKAAERAKAELAKPDLSKDQRELYETALRDSTNNLEKLEKGEKSDKG